MTVIIFLIVLAVLIFSHELGHFLVAKFFKLRVDEFGLGFPPRLFSRVKGETRYSLNLIPLGGFVSIFGENNTDEVLAESEQKREMFNQPKLVQAAVLVAGIVANLLLAWLLISVALSMGVPAAASDVPYGLTISTPRLMVTSVLAHSPAEAAGLKPGDKIVSLAASRDVVLTSPDVEITQNFIAAHTGKVLTITYTRGESQTLLKSTTTPVKGLVGDRAAIGIGLDLVGQASAPWPKNLIIGASLTLNVIKTSGISLLQVFWNVVFHGGSILSEVVGPIGLAGLVGDARTLGLSYLLFFVAFISVNLALFNLIPFPALDGGRLLFLLIEKIKGSRISPRVANAANLAGFTLLILFMILVTYHDLTRIF